MVFSPVLRFDLKTPCFIWKDSFDLKKSPGQLCSSNSSFCGHVLTASSARSVAANLVVRLMLALVMLARLSLNP